MGGGWTRKLGVKLTVTTDVVENSCGQLTAKEANAEFKLASGFMRESFKLWIAPSIRRLTSSWSLACTADSTTFNKSDADTVENNKHTKETHTQPR